MNDNDRYEWAKLTRDDKKLYVRVLREGGYSDEAIGNFFGTTKNAIVGFRHSQLPSLTSGPRATQNKVNRERFRDLLDLERMRELRKQGLSALPRSHPPAPPKQCEWPVVGEKGGTHPCGEPSVPGSKLCAAHREFALHPKR